MKKIIALILLLMLGWALCACGSSMEVVSESTNQEKVFSTDDGRQSDGRLEFDEPVLLAEDSFVIVEVTNFFEEVSVFGNAPEKEKYITLKFNNKTDYNLLVYLKQLFIGNDSVIIQNCNPTVEIAPGKSVVNHFKISTPANKPINAIEDLFFLEGTIGVYKDGADGKRSEVNNIPFSVETAFSDGLVVEEDSPRNAELALGETASTDMAEFTMTGFEIRSDFMVNAYKIQIREGKGTVYTPDKGMVYAAPIFTVRNTAKESYKLDRTIYFIVDYNDGYQYKMDDYTCYFTHEGGTWERNHIGTSQGQRPELSPLMSGEYQVFVPAIDLIATDTEAPLRIIVRLPASGGTQEFIYRIR